MVSRPPIANVQRNLAFSFFRFVLSFFPKLLSADRCRWPAGHTFDREPLQTIDLILREADHHSQPDWCRNHDPEEPTKSFLQFPWDSTGLPTGVVVPFLGWLPSAETPPALL